MGKNINPDIQPSLQASNDSYHDCVENFNLLYKTTSNTEKLTSLIHYHECYEIVFYVSANVEAYLDDSSYSLKSHDILLIPPRKIHKLNYPQPCNYIRYVFYFTHEHIENAFGPALYKKAIHFFQNSGCYQLSLSAQEYIHLNRVFQNMHECRQEPSYKSRELISFYASIILQEIYLISEKRPGVNQEQRSLNPVAQILRYINEHYHQNITLEILEEEFYLNKSYICRIFHRTMGISLINYLQCKRILEAQQLLLNTDLPIIEISMESGFNNVQHFYRVFKKITGLTPKEYKKHHLNTQVGQTFTLFPPK